MNSIAFRQGEVYNRRALHTAFGGQRQGGISTPRKYPLILLFTGLSGEHYGYHDEWTEQDTFLYTGEGQAGDMQFVRGNAAIRDSISDGKDLHLFKYVARTKVQYLGQMVCHGYRTKDAADVDGRRRKVIVFELIPLDNLSLPPDFPLSPAELDLPLTELRQRALQQTSGTADSAARQVVVRERSRAIRAYILRRANGICEGCGSPAPFKTPSGMPYLEPHHIRRLSDGGPDHPAWVAALCPNCHAKAHYSKSREAFNRTLASTVSAKESELQQGK